MAKIFNTLIRKRRGGGAAGAASWQPLVRVGVALSTVFRWLGNQTVGVALSLAPTRAVSQQTLGVSLTPIVSGASMAEQLAGVGLSTVADLGRYLQSIGCRIEREIISLAGRYGATSAAVSHPSGSTDWATPNNAVGDTNATNATVAGQALSAVDAVLTLSYAALTNKTALTISLVQLKVYAGLTKSITGTPSLILRYSLNGGTNYTVLQTITATNAGPFTFDLTSVIGGNWTNLQALKVQAEFIAALADITSNATLDAGEWLVDASYIPPTNNLSIGNVSAQENAGTMTFTVNRSGPSGTTSVNFATSDRTTAVTGDTAIVGEDYTSTSGTLTFTGSEASKTITVPLLDNAYSEPDRLFAVNLSAPSNGTLTNSQAIGTITDDEANKTFLNDLSGNGRDLTAGSVATTSRASSAAKFSNGRDFTDVANCAITRSDAAFNIVGDLAITAVFSLDSLSTVATVRRLAAYRDPGNANDDGGTSAWSVTVSRTGANGNGFQFGQAGTTPTAFNYATPLSLAQHTLTIRRDDTAKTIVVKLDGTEIINATYTGSPISATGTPLLMLGGQGLQNTALDGAIYDLRIWNTAKAQAALDAIVASSGKCRPDGDELAFYRMEDI